MKIQLSRCPAQIGLRVHLWQEWSKDGRGQHAIAKLGELVWQSVPPHEVVVSEGMSAQWDESEVLELYHSLRDELRRIGRLPSEPSEQGSSARDAHLKDMQSLAHKLADVAHEHACGHRR